MVWRSSGEAPRRCSMNMRRKPKIVDGEMLSVTKGSKGPILGMRIGRKELHVALDEQNAALLLHIKPYLKPFQRRLEKGKLHLEG
jgi:hypothetical protein